MPLNADQLRELMAGDAVAIRGVATLEPAGGPGDKIFPPSHAVDKNNTKPGAKYAFETRRIGGDDVKCVLIDSVQSQANRMEEALQALWSDKRIALPVVSVDFSSIAPEVGRVTSLTASHRGCTPARQPAQRPAIPPLGDGQVVHRREHEERRDEPAHLRSRVVPGPGRRRATD